MSDFDLHDDFLFFRSADTSVTMSNAPSTAPAYREGLPTPENQPSVRTIVKQVVDENVGKGRISIDELMRAVEAREKQVPPELERQLQRYRERIGQAAGTNVSVEKLEQGTAGVYRGRGNIALDQENIVPADDTDQAIRNAAHNTKFVRIHEEKHEEDGHDEPIKVLKRPEGAEKLQSATGNEPAIVKIGGAGFSATETIEGVTVDKTGVESTGGLRVSSTYMKYRADLRAAVARRGLTMNDVDAALKKGNLAELDDDYKKPGQQPIEKLAA